MCACFLDVSTDDYNNNEKEWGEEEVTITEMSIMSGSLEN